MSIQDISNEDRARVLVQALPYIQKYAGETVVVKYGGNAMINEELKNDVISDIVLMQLVGINVVLVHGGGPEISGMLKKIGKESRFVNGMRYTDEETMEIVQMVLIKIWCSFWKCIPAGQWASAVLTGTFCGRKRSFPLKIWAMWARSQR